MNMGLFSSLHEMVVVSHGTGTERIIVYKRIPIPVSSHFGSSLTYWFVYLILVCDVCYDHIFQQIYLNAYGMECHRTKKIFHTCLMKQLLSRLAGIWLTMLLIVVFFTFHLLLFPRFFDIILTTHALQWIVAFLRLIT